MSTKKVYSFLSQAFIFSAIMLISNIIATFTNSDAFIGNRVSHFI